MAARDIMPFKSAHGGTETVQWGQMTASEIFDIGEPGNIVDAGTLTEPATNGVEWAAGVLDLGFVAGIAAAGPAGGSETNDHAARIDPRTGVAFAALGHIPYWPINEGTLFITKNFHIAGGTTAAVPALTDIGESYQITHSESGTPDRGWGIEQTNGDVGLDVQANVIDVLDAQKSPIRNSGNAGVFLVFTITATLGAA